MRQQATALDVDYPRKLRQGCNAVTSNIEFTGIKVVDSFNASWVAVLITAYGMCVFRALLEYHIYAAMPPFLFSVYGVHYPLSFLCFATTIALLISLLTGYPTARTCKVVLAAMPIILVPPLIDACVYGLRARKILYLPVADDPIAQFVDAVFRRTLHDHISAGQLIVVHAIALCSGYFAWRITKRLSRTLLTWLSILIAIYVYAALPPAIISVSRNLNDVIRVLVGLEPLPEQSSLTGIITSYYEVEIPVYLLVGPLLVACVVFMHDRVVMGAVVKNVRLGRMLHYLLLTAFGVIAAVKNANGWAEITGAPTNPIAILTLFEAVATAFMGAVWINDFYDRQIDEICNRSRPIVSGAVSERAAILLAAEAWVLSVMCAWTLGYETLIWILAVLALAWMYSAPPLRLRRRFPVSALTIGAISWGVMQAGTSIVVRDHRLVPLSLGLGILFGVAMIATFKDLKDARGDRLAGVTTVATWLPEPWARLATCAAIWGGANVIALSLFDKWLALGFGVGGGALAAVGVWYARQRETLVFLMYHALFAAALVVWVSLC